MHSGQMIQRVIIVYRNVYRCCLQNIAFVFIDLYHSTCYKAEAVTRYRRQCDELTA
jgi:hypothetical protein